MVGKNVPIIILDDSEDEPLVVGSTQVSQRPPNYLTSHTGGVPGQLSGRGNSTAREPVPVPAPSNLGRYCNNIASVSKAQSPASQRPQAGKQHYNPAGAQPRVASRMPSSNASRASRFYNDIARHIIETFPYAELAKFHNLEVEDVRLAVLEKVVQPMLNETRAQVAREEARSKAQAEVQVQAQPKAQAQLYAQAQANTQGQAQTQAQTANTKYHTNVVQFPGYENLVYVQPYLQAPSRMALVDPSIIDPALMNPIPKSPKPANGSVALQNRAHEPAPQSMPDAAPESSLRKRQISEVAIVDLAAVSSTSTVQQGTSSKKVKIGPGPETKNTTPAPAIAFAPTPTPEGYASTVNPYTYCRITETTPTSGTITAAAPTPHPQPIVIDDEVPKDLPASQNLENSRVVVHALDNLGGTRSESEEPLAARCRSLRNPANGSSGLQKQITDNSTVTKRRNLYNTATQKDKEIWKKHVLDPLLHKTGKGGENLVDEGKSEAEVPEGFN